MAREIVKEAATVEEAIRLAAEERGVSPEQVKTEVLQEPAKKAFGLFGGNDAKVRVWVEESDGVAAAVTYLNEIMAAFDRADVTVSVERTEDGVIFRLDGEHLGFIIGRRGDTLDALQYLVSLVVNRHAEDYLRVSLDVGDYRDKRREALTELAVRVAGQVLKNHRRQALEPMSPYERRVIHTAIQEVEGVTSWSVGTVPHRHVVVGLEGDEAVGKEDAPAARAGRRDRGRSRGKGGKGGNGGNGGERRERRDREIAPAERQVRRFVSRNTPTTYAADYAPPSRTESEKESTATLYGRIDL